jgi:hypothetical protein
MISEIYNTLYTWIGSIFDEGMSLKVWQYIYGADVIATREDLITYLSEFLTLIVVALMALFILGMFRFVFRLIFRVFRW